MEKKTGPGHKAGAMGGKGFYIVLFLCAAVIGVSSWILLSGAGTNVEDEAEAVMSVSQVVVTSAPTPVTGQDEEEETGVPSQNTLETSEDEAEAVFSEAVVQYIWPVQGGVEMPYAVETLLYDSTMADWRTHSGIDIACENGSQVMAAAAGRVISVKDDDLYGTTVEIDHANGVHTIYSNLAKQPPVEEGDTVTMGQVIASVGGTALAETNMVPHLHFAMELDGAPTNPIEYLPETE